MACAKEKMHSSGTSARRGNVTFSDHCSDSDVRSNQLYGEPTKHMQRVQERRTKFEPLPSGHHLIHSGTNTPETRSLEAANQDAPQIEQIAARGFGVLQNKIQLEERRFVREVRHSCLFRFNWQEDARRRRSHPSSVLPLSLRVLLVQRESVLAGRGDSAQVQTPVSVVSRGAE